MMREITIYNPENNQVVTRVNSVLLADATCEAIEKRGKHVSEMVWENTDIYMRRVLTENVPNGLPVIGGKHKRVKRWVTGNDFTWY